MLLRSSNSKWKDEAALENPTERLLQAPKLSV